MELRGSFLNERGSISHGFHDWNVTKQQDFFFLLFYHFVSYGPAAVRSVTIFRIYRQVFGSFRLLFFGGFSQS